MNASVLPPVRIRSLANANANANTHANAHADATATAAAMRLLPSEPLDHQAHGAVYGNLPRLDPGHIMAAAERSGLSGQGGAAFPAYRKMAAVREAARRARRRPVVVANGSEGEPASAKDKALLWHAPHLVLDGVALAAAAVGADRAFLAVEGGHGLRRYLVETNRQRPSSAVPVTIVEVPSRFLSGQESALVSFLDGGPALPRFQSRPVFEQGVGGDPTLVQNVETLAHLALIARHGPAWYRSGAATSLFTVRYADSTPTVVEAAPGTPLQHLTGAVSGQAILVGGYHGTWLPLEPAARSGREAGAGIRAITGDTSVSAEALGVPLGAGLLAVLPHDRCGLVETASILRYLALESAGQCGPCLNGLPRMAAAFGELARPTPRSDLQQIRDDLSRWAGLVTGRGACRHPDGTARLARSALITFAAEADAHSRGRCRACARPPMLPTATPATSQSTVTD
ncbi:NADH-ubiquinone oxidoreductase-F iron-sulfur binding region domain-containing protein [Catenulispora pinisilvae]|uniref:NADH-ubiquinone oxidoreductase-F iron-sulfur binding region domain-containing protein n=1 Tax=Catenulispora pinisilvae TaxID=2705253 RepID=UPI001E4B6A44|nr:NADH-ubiquinone oxidoreductase-F iron-sulfur binding region domain-containing protein [Catenulispora pinisilvae]